MQIAEQVLQTSGTVFKLALQCLPTSCKALDWAGSAAEPMCLKHEFLIGWEVHVGFPFIWFSPFGMRFQWKKSVKDLTHDLQQIEADPSCGPSPVLW